MHWAAGTPWDTLAAAMRPDKNPIGLQLARTARVVARAFDEALEAAGGSLPVWLVLLNVKIQRTTNQRELADAVGITGATLTHHLNAMEQDGLITRRRDPLNRRNHVVELTPAGEQAFLRLATAAQAFDQSLRGRLNGADLDTLQVLLERLGASVTSP
jgi:MarR family transcriptional regulator for hemolysin